MYNLVFKHKNESVTSSRIISSVFTKSHKDILRAIRTLDCSDHFNRRNFAPTSYLDSMNRDKPEYLITRDGFSFLVMGFTGKRAAKFKEDFIQAFNDAENALNPTEDEIIMRALQISQERLRLQSEQLTLQAPKVRYHDEVLQSESTYTVRLIAKELGMSARRLNQVLKQMGVQYAQGDVWVLYAKYQGEGYTKTKTFPYRSASGEIRTSMQTVWTEKGRRFIHSLISD